MATTTTSTSSPTLLRPRKKPTLQTSPKPVPSVLSFEAMKLDGSLMKGLVKMNWTNPTRIQAMVVPTALKGENIVASSHSGTGKTGAYLLPILQKLLTSKQVKPDTNKNDISICQPKVLIMTPSSELCAQIVEQVRSLTKFVDQENRIGVLALGNDYKMSQQVALLNENIDVIVATPGRLVQHLERSKEVLEEVDLESKKRPVVAETIRKPDVDALLKEYLEKGDAAALSKVSKDDLRKSLFDEDEDTAATPNETSSQLSPNNHSNTPKILDCSRVNHFILDECDKLFSLTFYSSLRKSWNYLPRPKQHPMQTMIFSATITPAIHDFILRFAPRHTLIHLNETCQVPSNIKQILFPVSSQRKFGLLKHLLSHSGSPHVSTSSQILVFVRSAQRADRLAEALQRLPKSYNTQKTASLHSDMTPQKIRKVLDLFKRGEIRVLVATDIATRGIDFPSTLSHVINYDVPFSVQEYVHRAGRTGRGEENKGVCITFQSKDVEISYFQHQFVYRNERAWVKEIMKAQKGYDTKLEKWDVPGEWNDEAKEIVSSSTENIVHDRAGSSVVIGQVGKQPILAPKEIIRALEDRVEKRVNRKTPKELEEDGNDTTSYMTSDDVAEYMKNAYVVHEFASFVRQWEESEASKVLPVKRDSPKKAKTSKFRNKRN